MTSKTEVDLKGFKRNTTPTSRRISQLATDENINPIKHSSGLTNDTRAETEGKKVKFVTINNPAVSLNFNFFPNNPTAEPK